MMAKPMPNIQHNSNCSCCGKQSSFKEIGRKPFGFGPLQSAPLPTKSTPHIASKSLERASTEVHRRKSLQHGNEANEETSPEHIFNKLSSGVHINMDIATEIAEDVVDRSMLQAKESRLNGTSRDKESLLEECFDLKTALGDQHYHLQLHKVHHESVNLEQRRMETAIEELEVANGLAAPRTGGPSRLKSKLLGLKCRQQEYFSLLTTLRDDLAILRKDPLVSLTNEVDVERDIYATETRRLQKLVRCLRTFYHKVCAENNEVVRLGEDIAKFTIQIKDALINLKGKNNLIDQMKEDINKAKFDALESQKNAQNAIYKAKELDSHSTVLKDMLTHEKSEGRDIHKQTYGVWEQTCNVQEENKDREIARKMAAMTAVAKAAALAARVAKKGGIGSERGKIGKLKEYSPNSNQDSNSMGSYGVDSDNIDSINSKKGKRGKDGKDGKDGKGGKGSKGGKDGKEGIRSEGGKIGKLQEYSASSNHDPNSMGSDGVDSDSIDSINSKKGKGGKDGKGGKGDKGGKGGKGEEQDVKKIIGGAKEAYVNEIGIGATKYLENIPTLRLGSPNAKGFEAEGSPSGGYGAEGSPNGGYRAQRSPNGNNTKHELVKKMLQKDVGDGEERFLAIVDELQYQSPRPKSAKEEKETNQLATELEVTGAVELAKAEALARLKDEEARRIKDVEEAKRQVRVDNEEKERMRKKAVEEEARIRKAAEDATKARLEGEAKKRKTAEEAAQTVELAKAGAIVDTKKKKDAKEAMEVARLTKVAADTKALAEASGSGKDKAFIDTNMQGIIKTNIKEVLGHLETISETVQQKASPSGTAESTAKNVLEKLDKP